MTRDSQAQVLARVDGSRRFDLAVDYFPGMPCWLGAGDPKYDIWMTHTPAGSVADAPPGPRREMFETFPYAGTAVTMYTHVGTHVCALNHLGLDGRFWNGWTAAEHLGSRAWTVGGNLPPIIARALLLDVAAVHGVPCLPDSYAITGDDLRAAEIAGGVRVQRGDVVLVRTGRMSRWPEADAFMARPPGLGMDGARYLCEEAGAMCVGVDCGGEALPPEEPDGFLPVHAYLFTTGGTTVIENMWLEDLADAGVHELALLAFPLKLRGSTGLPVRPVALPLG